MKTRLIAGLLACSIAAPAAFANGASGSHVSYEPQVVYRASIIRSVGGKDGDRIMAGRLIPYHAPPKVIVHNAPDQQMIAAAAPAPAPSMADRFTKQFQEYGRTDSRVLQAAYQQTPIAASTRAAPRKSSGRLFPEEKADVSHCVAKAAQAFGVSETPLFLILDVERGTLGRTSQNKNGTYDMGPMQINSGWLKTLGRHGIKEHDVINNLCVNIYVGAWIYHQEYRKTGNVISAIQRYHSPTPKHQQRYIGLIADRARERMNKWGALTMVGRSGLASL